MKIIEINFKRLISLLTPSFLRRQKWTSMLIAIIYPIKTLHDKFSKNRTNNICKINHNGQVCYLKAVLNNEFDGSERRITIEDIDTKDWLIVYKEVENKPKFLETKILYREDTIGTEKADFMVIVPFTLSRDQRTKMHAFIKEYKLVSKRYTIQSL